MKTKSKALLLTLCAVLLVTASVLGTMAYLTSTDAVENTFTVGSVAITLDELDVKPDGTKETDARVDANEYKLMPGHEYIKDPTVHVADNSEDSWIFVKVENGIADIEAASKTSMADGAEYATIAEQMITNGWSLVLGTDNVYAYKEIVSAGDDVVVFDEFMISGSAEADDLAGYDTAKISVTAYAVQADGFDTAAAAWNAAAFTN